MSWKPKTEYKIKRFEYIYVLNSKGIAIRKNIVEKMRLFRGLTQKQLCEEIQKIGYVFSLSNYRNIENHEIALTRRNQNILKTFFNCKELFQKPEPGVEYDYLNLKKGAKK